tara:strand:- start:6163 stop:7224 length:1062 start_codon:yes stop_codon:yes gene_type:complete
MNVLIFGAGSIGNHLANASRHLNWQVTVLDIDSKALTRMKEEIYPSRYGSWDSEIKLIKNKNEITSKPDFIIIGTPPDSHLRLAYEALNMNPNGILIEKPLCTPSLDNLSELKNAISKSSTKVFIGYNHVLGKASRRINSLLNSNNFGEVITIDVEFREHWGGIFKAHHWLNGPSDSYLGSYKKGGGATGEHSHAINFWQYLADLTNFGKISKIDACMDFVKDNKCFYDRVASINLISEKELIGRVIQDVVTKPSKKWARIQFDSGFIEWNCESNIKDSVKFQDSSMKESKTIDFHKTRPDDFILELEHIKDHLSGDSLKHSPISFEKGCDTMFIISRAYKSGLQKSSVFTNV